MDESDPSTAVRSNPNEPPKKDSVFFGSWKYEMDNGANPLVDKAGSGVKNRNRNETKDNTDSASDSDSSEDDGGDDDNDNGNGNGNDDDDTSDGNNSVYQLQKVCTETNEVGVGSLVRVARERKWGKIVGQHSEELFDVQCEGKKLRNVSVADMLTLESPQLKDDKLRSGDIVYAAWPGTDPANDLCFWGRINEENVGASSGDSKNHFSIIFFPTDDSHGLVDTTDDLESEFIYTRKEAIFLMESSDILGTVELPSSHRMSLKELIGKRKEQQEASEEKQKGTTKKKAKASKTRKPSAARKPKCAAAAASSKPRKRRKTAAKKSAAKPKRAAAAAAGRSKPKKRRKVAAKKSKSNDDVLQDPTSYRTIKQRDLYLDNLYLLESKDYKDSVLEVDDKVYAVYPGVDPENEGFYWGRIARIFESSDKIVYKIKFHDGDTTTKHIESSHLHRYGECMHMMEKGWLINDKPPKNL